MCMEMFPARYRGRSNYSEMPHYDSSPPGVSRSQAAARPHPAHNQPAASHNQSAVDDNDGSAPQRSLGPAATVVQMLTGPGS